MEEKKNYVIYKLMKQRYIGTLDLHRVLNRIGVEVPQKTLHTYIKSDFKNAKNPELKEVALEMIKNYDKLITNLKKNRFV
tara:strand:+ start:4612 stop:4851 length:240 start_codon:yes stop_codon:yes gene_type:complete